MLLPDPNAGGLKQGSPLCRPSFRLDGLNVTVFLPTLQDIVNTALGYWSVAVQAALQDGLLQPLGVALRHQIA